MIKIDRILCPVDFSESSAQAFAYAQSLARRYRARLQVAHVVMPVFAAYPSYTLPDLAATMFQDLRVHADQELQPLLKGHHPHPPAASQGHLSGDL